MGDGRMHAFGRLVIGMAMLASTLVTVTGTPSTAATSGPSCSMLADGGYHVSWTGLPTDTAYVTVERKVSNRFWWRGRAEGAADGTFDDGPTPRTAGYVEYRILAWSSRREVLSTIDCATLDSPGVDCVIEYSVSSVRLRWTNTDIDGDNVVRRQVHEGGPWYWRGRTGATEFDDTGASPASTTYRVFTRSSEQRITGIATCGIDVPVCAGVVEATDSVFRSVRVPQAAEADDGRVFGASNIGLVRLEPRGAAAVWLPVPLEEPIAPSVVVPIDDGQLMVAGTQAGEGGLWRVDPDSGSVEAIVIDEPLSFVPSVQPRWLRTSSGVVYFQAATPEGLFVLWRFDPASAEPARSVGQYSFRVTELGDGSVAYAVLGGVIIESDGDEQFVPVGSAGILMPFGPWPDPTDPGGFFAAASVFNGGNGGVVHYVPERGTADFTDPLVTARGGVVGPDGLLYLDSAKILDPVTEQLVRTIPLNASIGLLPGERGVWMTGWSTRPEDAGTTVVALVDRETERFLAVPEITAPVRFLVELGPERVLLHSGQQSFVVDLGCP